MGSRVAICVVSWIVLGNGLHAEAAAPALALVPGFDRFARHAEIDSTVGGRLLLTELSCTACHASDSKLWQPKGGPRLSGAGNRLQPGWIKQFLSAPQTAKPGTTMPDLFAGWPEAEKQAAIESLTAFLGSQREEFPVLKASGLNPVPLEFWKRGRSERGKQLYHQIGCVACHQADSDYETVETKPSPIDQLLEQLDPEELKELGLASKARRVESVPHGDLPAKYTPRSLTFFLLDPERTRPAGRMPSFQLEAVDAADIAAYLLREQASQDITERPAKTELIEKGRRLFSELRCINCHEVPGQIAKRPAKPLEALNPSSMKNCFSQPGRGLPHYALDAVQTAALQTLLKNEESPQPTKSEQLQFSLLQMNCYGCHEFNNQGGVGRFRKPYFETVGHVDIGDEGRLPPPLTGLGRKLQPAWMKQVFRGKGSVRPHMRARMPVFPSHITNPLPGLFGQVDPPSANATEKQIFGQLTGLAPAGRTLMDQGCVQCHAFRGESLPGVVGVDLEGITQRVQPQWFQDFLLNPGDLKPRTRMPTFFPNGQSQNKQVLDGNTDRQIAAMWAYLKELDRQPLPEKIEQVRSQNYELKPVDKPIVLRTFMKEAGTHAIAVGFPQKVHLAFDAETAQLAAAWRGRFLDAQGTWFSRFTPPAEPLGEKFLTFPTALPLAHLESAEQPWPKLDPLNPPYQFRGYRLDKQGVPTFLYRFGEYDIQDRIEPGKKQTLHRRLTITQRQPNAKSDKLWFRPLAGKTLKRVNGSEYQTESGLTVMVSQPLGEAGKIVRSQSTTAWVIPLPVDTETTIEIQYDW